MSQKDPADRANRDGGHAGSGAGSGSFPDNEATDTLVNEQAVGTGRAQLPGEWANAARQQATHALGSAASTIRQQAGTLQTASQQLQEPGQSLSAMLSALERQVRRQPLAAVGGAFVVGFIIGKLTE